tara:strand:- start:64 stop:168 length:105 start_codon:yes stop_codon:yes gene_type:complete
MLKTEMRHEGKETQIEQIEAKYSGKPTFSIKQWH